MYKFVNTTEQPDSALLPSEALRFNGEWLEDIIPGYRTLYVTGRELLESEIISQQVGLADGSRYQGKRHPSRTITVTYQLVAENATAFRVAYNKLCGVLDAENAELIFNDEPDKYFIGTKADAREVDPGRNQVVSSIDFYCADPFKYSTTLKYVTNKSGSGYTDTIELTNDATEAAFLNVSATMKSENGYLGLVLDDRFYQVGNPEEVDGETRERSEKLFDDHFTADRGWLLNQGVTPPVTPVRKQTGTVTYVKETGNEGYVKASGYGTGDSWHGPALTKIVPADSQGNYPVNWKAEWRFDFNTDGEGSGAGKQIGHNSVTFSDENDDIICSVVFEDNNSVNQRSDMVVYIGDKRTWDTKETQKFYVTGRGDAGPIVIVEKTGSKITVSFSYAGIKKTFTAKRAAAQLRKVTWYCAAYKSYAGIRNNLIRAMNVTKHNVQYYVDIPNFLSGGDVVELDSEKNELYINDIKDWDRVDIGSRPFLLPPGTHDLKIAVSDWAEIPEVKVTYRERWL